MNKTIQRPLACRNAHCGAMCSPADAEFMGNPSKCYKYERRDDLYRQAEILDKIKQARNEIYNLVETVPFTAKTQIEIEFNTKVLAILDELIESEE